jgi:hypothetical protein
MRKALCQCFREGFSDLKQSGYTIDLRKTGRCTTARAYVCRCIHHHARDGHQAPLIKPGTFGALNPRCDEMIRGDPFVYPESPTFPVAPPSLQGLSACHPCCNCILTYSPNRTPHWNHDEDIHRSASTINLSLSTVVTASSHTARLTEKAQSSNVER